jgi:secreted PhoX family phosphatase
VQARHDSRTVIMAMEDGPSALDPSVENSQLYMYVGTKERYKGATVLRRNGLDNGTLYVAVAQDGLTGEDDFAGGDVAIRWVPIPNAGELDGVQLEAASDAVGALRFARPEDGAFNNRNRNQFFFVTTGGAAGVNELGRLYSLQLDRHDPTAPGTLSVVYNADQIVAGGGDIAISPDNVGVSDKYLMINEDGTTESRVVMGAKGRDGSIWRFDVNRYGVDAASAVRVAELDPPGRDAVAVGPGVWETSGIIDAKGLLSGKDAWLFDVQAHAPTAAPAPNTVEDGQLLLMARRT